MLTFRLPHWALPLYISLLSSMLLVACNPGNTPAELQNAATDENFRWRMVTVWPPNFPILQEGAEEFAREVEIMSRGQLRIKVYAADELVPALQVFDAVSQGTVQAGHSASYYWAGKVPEAQFFSSVPFGMSPQEMNAWLHKGGGMELWREVYRKFRLLPIPMGNTGVQMGGWFKKRIDSLADIQGIRMRIPGLGGKVLQRAGGNPVLIAGSEVYTALERGTIDATEWISPFHDLRLGLDRAARFYYYPGWHEPGTMLELIINTAAWEALPPHLQSIVNHAALATGQRMYAAMEQENQQSLEQLEESSHVEILRFPEELLTELYDLSQQVLAEEAQENVDFNRVYQAWRAFREQHQNWSRLSEHALLQTTQKYTD